MFIQEKKIFFSNNFKLLMNVRFIYRLIYLYLNIHILIEEYMSKDIKLRKCIAKRGISIYLYQHK